MSEFKIKTPEELKELDLDALTKYYNEKNAYEKNQFQSQLGEKASKEDLEAFRKKMDANIEEQRKAVNLLFKDLGIRIAKREASENTNTQSIKSLLTEKKEELTKLKNSSSATDNVQIELKAVGDMSLAGNTTGQIPQAYRLPGFNDVAERQVRFLDLLQRGRISKNIIEWVYVANEEGGAAATAEGATKSQYDFELLVGSQKVEKVTAYITITDEMLDDVEAINTLINNKLSTKVLQKVEEGAWSGNGTSPNLHGVYTVATAFSPGTFATGSANEVDNPNSIDVLGVAANQIKLANQTMPTRIVMNPTDVTALKMQKVSSTDKRYIERLSMIGGSLSMDGIPIVESTLVTAGTYLIGDFNKATILDKQDLVIEIGYNADNFVKNFKTIRAEWRGVVFVEHNDRNAFVKGVFATDIAAIAAA